MAYRPVADRAMPSLNAFLGAFRGNLDQPDTLEPPGKKIKTNLQIPKVKKVVPPPADGNIVPLPQPDMSRVLLDRPRTTQSDKKIPNYPRFVAEVQHPTETGHVGKILCPFCGPDIEKPYVLPRRMNEHLQKHGINNSKEAERALGIERNHKTWLDKKSLSPPVDPSKLAHTLPTPLTDTTAIFIQWQPPPPPRTS